MERCDALLSPTRYMLQWLADNHIRTPRDVFVTPLPYRAATSASQRPAVDNDHRISIGRTETRKGVHIFADALRRLHREGVALPRVVSFLGSHALVLARPARDYLDELRHDVPSIEFRIMDNLDFAGAMDYIARTRGLVVMPSLL